MANAKEILEFILKGNADDAIKAFEKTGKSADKDLGKAEKKLDKLGGTLTKTGAGAVAFAGVAGAAVVKTVGNFNDLAIEAGKGADATGLAVDEWSRWIEVAGDVGVESAIIEKSFLKFNKSVADGVPSVEKYGVEIVKTKDGVVDANASFINAIDTIGKIEDPTKRAQAAQELFGRGYGEIAELIEMGAGNVKTALDAVSDTKVIDQGELDNARDYRASMDELGDAVQDFTLAIGQGATPVVQGFADVSSKAIGAVSSLDSVTGGAAGKVLALGVAGVGAVGALSLVVGQAVKMRNNLRPLTDRLRTTEGGLTGMGKAAAGAGVALGALAAVEVAGQVFNTVTDAAGRNERSLQALTITLGEYETGQADATAVLDDFQSKVSDVGSTFSLGNIIKNFGKEINLVNAEGESFAYNIETIDKAFQDLLDTSPQQAQLLVDALREQAAAMGEGAYEFDGYIQLANRYQERVDLQIGSTEALTEAQEENTTAVQAAALAAEAHRQAVSDAEQVVKDYKAEVDKQTEAAKASAEAILEVADAERERIKVFREGADASFALDEATDTFNDTVQGLSESIEAAGDDQEALNRVYRQASMDGTAVADATVRLAEEQAKQMGVTLNAKDSLDLWNKTAIAQATQLTGPSRDAILGYIADVNGIPPEKLSEIRALIDEGKLDEAQAALDSASAARTAAITADAKTADAEAALNLAARDRDVLFKGVPIFGSGKAYASGTPSAPPGVALVGERGPELVEFQGGERVHTANQTAAMLRGSPAGLAIYAPISVTAGWGANGEEIGKAIARELRTQIRLNGPGILKDVIG